MDRCTFPSCTEAVSRPGFKLCYKHWKTNNTRAAAPAPVEARSPTSAPAQLKLLSATGLGEKLELASQKVNLIFSELGWISREKKGWVTTTQGTALGGIQREHNQTGVPYVVWPEAILEHKALLKTIQSIRGEQAKETSDSQHHDEIGFRERFPATYRATDGHLVRSRAEMLIDNWLYMAGIVHAYERQLPIEEELYCDFYIPEGKVYIEYWGLENDPQYAARRQVKQELYHKYKFHLIELADEHIRNLDDHLPKMLLKFNVIVA